MTLIGDALQLLDAAQADPVLEGAAAIVAQGHAEATAPPSPPPQQVAQRSNNPEHSMNIISKIHGFFRISNLVRRTVDDECDCSAALLDLQIVSACPSESTSCASNFKKDGAGVAKCPPM